MPEGDVDRQRLTEEAEVADGIGTREQVEPADWAQDLSVGDRVAVEPAADVDSFEAVIRGFSKDHAFLGWPAVHPDVPGEAGDNVEWAVLGEDDEWEVNAE